MNRVYSLVWNRTLRSVQVASELTTSTGGSSAAVGAGPTRLRRHPLALACVVTVALSAVALPAWSAMCTVDGVTYTDCIQGANGGVGAVPFGGIGGASDNAGGVGAARSSGSAPNYANGGKGNGLGQSGGAGGALSGVSAGGYGGIGSGRGGSVGTAGSAGSGGGGGGVGSDGMGGGGGGGASYSTGSTATGGGGGGGGALGATINTSTTYSSAHAVLGGNGGNGGNYSLAGAGGGGAFGGGGGGGGAGALVGAGTLTNQGLIAGGIGGQGGTSKNNQGNGNFSADGGGGAGVLMAVGTSLINGGTVHGGNGGGARYGSTFSGGGGAGVAGAGFVLQNPGTITGGDGGETGVSGGAGSGASGVISTGGSAIITSGYIGAGMSAGGAPGAVRANAVQLSGGGNTLILEVGSTVTGNIVSTSGTTNGGDTLTLGDDTLGANPGPGGSATLAINTVSGFAQHDKTGTSTWTLTGANGDTGSWNVQQGSLIVGTSVTTASLAAPVTVASGATLGGYGSVGTTTVAGGTLAPGSATTLGTAGTFGTLTVNGNLTLQNGSVIDLNLGAPTASNPPTTAGSGDHVNVTGSLGMSGTTLNVGNINNSIGPGLYNVITYASTAPEVTSGLSVAGSAPAGQNYSVQYAAGQVNLLDAPSTIAFWSATPGAFGGTGTWTTTSRTWTDSTGTAPLAPMSPVPGFAEFEGTPGTVTVDSSAAPIDVTGMQFFVPGYDVVGKTATDAVTLVGTASSGTTTAPIINVGDGTSSSASTSVTIDAMLVGSEGLTKTDYGTLVLGGANFFMGGVTVGGGTLEVAGGGALGTSGSDVTVDNTAGEASTLKVDSGVTLSRTPVTLKNGGALNNAGTITSGNAAVRGNTGAADVLNTGIIRGGNDAIALTGGGSVSNSGTIDATGTTRISVFIEGALGHVTNNTGGSISASDGPGVYLASGGSVTNAEGAAITGGGGDAGVVIGGGAGTLTNAGTISGGVSLGSGFANAATLTSGGSIAGDLDIGTNVGSTLTLGGTGTQLYSDAVTGTTTFDGALTMADTGTWVIDSDDLASVSGTTIDAGGTLQVGNGSATGSIGNGNIIDNGSLVFDRNDALVFTGALSGTGSLQQEGTGGTLTLDGANAYSGPTTVTAGTLNVGDAMHATASIAGSAQVDSGATLGGFGTVGAAGSTTEIESGGSLSPGAGTGSIGTLNVGGNLTLDHGSALDIDLGAPGMPNPFTTVGTSDNVSVAGTLTFNGGSTLNLASSSVAPGFYNLASYGTLATTGCSFTGGTACLTLGTLPSGTQASYYTVVNNASGKQIDLYNTAGQALGIWAPNGAANLGGTGTWSATSATWTNTEGNGPSAMIPSPGFAIFQGAPGTVTVSDGTNNAAPVSATGLQFAVDGYTLTGGALTLADDAAGNAPTIEVGDGSVNSANMTATISNQLLGNGFTKTGGGTLAFVGTQNRALGPSDIESVAVQDGTLQIGSATAPLLGTPGVGGGLLATTTMAPGTTLSLINGELGGGGTAANAAAVTGSGFSVTTQTTGTGASVLMGIGALTSGAQPADGAGAAINGNGFTVTFTGNTAVLGAGAVNTGYASADTPAITGSDFHVVNDSNMGVLAPPGLGDWFGVRYGITGGAAPSSVTGVAGVGGAGISGTGFTVENNGGIYGGVGGATVTGTPGTAGVGGAGISGTGFTLTNTGNVTGGAGGQVLAVGSPLGTGVVTVAGGAGVYSTGGATVINEGSISGGQSGAGLAPANAIDFTGGGNTLELVAGHPGTFNGAIVVTRAARDAADTLELGGDTGSATFDVSQLSAGALFGEFNAVEKSGASTWTLTGATSAVTPWTLDAGMLSVSSDANLGATAGTLTLNGGTLENTAAFSTARDVSLAGTGAFQIDADLVVSGVVSGTGSIAKTGNATLTLTGANTFTGGTLINAGEVDVGNAAALGTGKGAMAAGTTLGFVAGGLNLANAFALSGDPAFDVAAASQTDTVGGVIADGTAPGTLEKTGAGTLVLTGDNTYTGGTTISAGTLQVGNGGTTSALGTGAITDNGTLVFDRSDAIALPAGLTGMGALIQQGAGGFTVDGDDSGFAGTTTIKAGTATVGDDSHPAASLGGMVNIAGGATLTGIGTIGGLDLSGTLSPGGSTGTLHVSGDATFNAGSTFNVEADPNGSADQLAVTGKTSIKGGNTVVLAQPGNWAPSTTYMIITSGGGVSGQFAGVSDDQAFLTPSLAYGADDVTLTLSRNQVTFPSVGTTPNQKGVATAIEDLGTGNALYDAVVKLNAADAQDAFNQTSGEYHASEQAARIDDSRYIREAMDQRLRAGDADPEATKVGNLTAWAHAWGHWGTLDGDGNAAKLADNGDGLLIGADLPVAANARVGVTGGASRNSLSVKGRDSWGRDTSMWLGTYGGLDFNAFSLGGGIAYAWDQIPTNQQIAFPGYTDRLSSNATGHTLTGFIEGAWTFHFRSGTISPFLNLAHTKVTTGASTEAGGAAALHAYSSSENVSFSTLGARGQIDFANHLNLHGELGWQHAFGDTTPQRDLGFVAGGPTFTEYGVPIAKNAGLGRIGLGWQQGNVAISADYEGLSGDGAKDQAAKLSVSVRF